MELPWQSGVKARLNAAIASGRLGHAVLVSGYPGWGESRLCAWLALTLLGADLRRDATAMAHPDFRWVAPEESPSGGSIKVEQIRALTEFALGKPQMAPVKVAVPGECPCHEHQCGECASENAGRTARRDAPRARQRPGRVACTYGAQPLPDLCDPQGDGASGGLVDRCRCPGTARRLRRRTAAGRPGGGAGRAPDQRDTGRPCRRGARSWTSC